jgi:hypothetical protein
MALVHRAVDLVGRDLQVARLAGAARRASSSMHADDARREECLGIEDRAVDVRLGGEVEHRIRLVDEGSTTSGSAMSPRTNVNRAAISGSSRTGARFASFPA